MLALGSSPLRAEPLPAQDPGDTQTILALTEDWDRTLQREQPPNAFARRNVARSWNASHKATLEQLAFRSRAYAHAVLAALLHLPFAPSSIPPDLSDAQRDLIQIEDVLREASRDLLRSVHPGDSIRRRDSTAVWERKYAREITYRDALIRETHFPHAFYVDESNGPSVPPNASREERADYRRESVLNRAVNRIFSDPALTPEQRRDAMAVLEIKAARLTSQQESQVSDDAEASSPDDPDPAQSPDAH